jgi:hypothetical protein
MRIRAVTLVAALVSVGMLVVGGASAGAASSSKPAACTGSTKAQAIKQIKAAYDMFLNGTTTPPRTNEQKKAAVQGMSDAALGALFDKTQAANAASAATTTVKVTAVKCTSKSGAEVTGTLVVNKAPLQGIFPNPGLAVIDGGTWKVAKKTFCDFEALADSSITQSGPCAVM